MPRLSIDLTEGEHRCLKACAALEGKSLKAYVLERVLAGAPETAALAEFLKPRIEEAERGAWTERSFKDIARAARSKQMG